MVTGGNLSPYRCAHPSTGPDYLSKEFNPHPANSANPRQRFSKNLQCALSNIYLKLSGWCTHTSLYHLTLLFLSRCWIALGIQNRVDCAFKTRHGWVKNAELICCREHSEILILILMGTGARVTSRLAKLIILPLKFNCRTLSTYQEVWNVIIAESIITNSSTFSAPIYFGPLCHKMFNAFNVK